jgi:uncharacterized membrane protein YhfC
MMVRWLAVMLTLGAALALAGCGPVDGPEPPAGARIPGATLQADVAGSRFPFALQVDRAEEPIGVDIRGTLQRGSFRVQLRTTGGQVDWELDVSQLGPFAINTVVRPADSGAYELGLVWDGPVSATYSLAWAPGQVEVPRVSPVAVLSGLGMVAVAAGYAVWGARARLPWTYLGLGAMAWVVTVVVKFVLAAAANGPIYAALTGALPEAAAEIVMSIYIGVLTGVTEVLIVWLVLRYTRLGKVGWNRALGFGIGFGAIEALLLGINSLVSVVAGLATPNLVPPAALEELARLNNGLILIAPVWERFFTVLVHMLSNVLLFYGVARGEARWLWASFAYKSAIDAVAGYAGFWGLGTVGRIWLIETIVGVFGIMGWLGLRWLSARYPDGQGPGPGEARMTAADPQ